MPQTVRLTTAQALVKFLAAQHSERDGIEARLIEGVFGIFGHGNVAGLGEALYSARESMPYHMARNEQSMVHTAVGFARMRNRLSTLACTSSVGPGATNMVTGAALATINRLPVLLLPGDVFASRAPDPVLQQLESGARGDISVNDCFIPVSRYFDRIARPEQLGPAALNAMRVLTSPADTGAVTLALPQDVQAEAHDFPTELFTRRVWRIPRANADAAALERAAAWIRGSHRPLIVAGGGVTYSGANAALAAFARDLGIPVAETQAGKGSIPHTHAQSVGAIGATGGLAANRIAHDADLVIGIGTRWSDFTTASKTLFADPNVRFININVAEFDAYKNAALPLTGDARTTITALSSLLGGFHVSGDWSSAVVRLRDEWNAEIDSVTAPDATPATPLRQRHVIRAVNDTVAASDVVVCAAGSMPGDLHKLWRATDPKQYHVEYGYSCMGYELAGALGVKMAAPERAVVAMVGDGSYLMLNDAITTSVEENMPIVVILVDNSGYASIGNLARSVGIDGFGTLYRRRDEGIATDSHPDGPRLPLDLPGNARSLGADVVIADSIEEFTKALHVARTATRTTVICVTTDRYDGVPGYDSWWDVPVAQVSDTDAVVAARRDYETAIKNRRPLQ